MYVTGTTEFVCIQIVTDERIRIIYLNPKPNKIINLFKARTSDRFFFSTYVIHSNSLESTGR